MAINPATGYVAGSAADKAALSGSIPKKTTTPTTPKTANNNPVGTPAWLDTPGVQKTPAKTTNNNPVGTPAWLDTPGVQKTPAKTTNNNPVGTPAWLDTPGVQKPVVPSFTGSTNYTSPTTGFTPVDPSQSKDIIAREAYATLKKQYPDASNDWLSLQAQQIADRTSGELDPQYENRLKQMEEEAQREADRQQANLERERRNMQAATDRAVRDYGEQIDPMFEAQREQVRKEADQRNSIQERMLGARGGLTSAYGAQQLEGIQEDLTTVLRGIEAEKEAKMSLFRAQREGADAETLSAMMANVQQAQTNAANLRAESLKWLMEAEIAAKAAGDTNMQAFYEQMAAAIVEDAPSVDEERSRQAGYFIDADGNFMVGGDGEPMPFNPNFKTTGVFQTGNQMAIAIIGPDGVPKVTTLGPAKPTSSGNQGPSTKTVSRYVRDKETGQYGYISIPTPKAGEVELIPEQYEVVSTSGNPTTNNTSSSGVLDELINLKSNTNTPTTGGVFNLFRR